MTIAQALQVRVGDYLVSRHSGSLAPRRVTRVWVNEKKTIAQFYCHALAVGTTGWIDCAGLEFPPAGQRWNKAMSRWEPTA